MSKKYFGTDGIRGEFGGSLINPEFACALGMALGRYLDEAGGRKLVLIGRDTRASGLELEQALCEGLAARKVETGILGIVPTPLVSKAVCEGDAGLGVVISASHNPASDNGIKLFNANGLKLSDEEESHLEALIDTSKESSDTGELKSVPCGEALPAYRRFAVSKLPAGCLLGWKIVVDTANGATVETTPMILQELGAEVIPIGNQPDGSNINAGVGSEHPEEMSAMVKAQGAQLGIAHDGDGDRVVFCDETGSVLDGDETLAILGLHALRKGKLARNTLVATVMSNLGLDKALEDAGGRVERVPVGDRHVIRKMQEQGYAFGGEASGHIVVGEYSKTGDGMLAALKLIEAMLDTGQPLSELRRCIRLFPQVLCNLRVKEKIPLDELPDLQAGITELENSMTGRARLLVRYSGTEPKIRLLIEGEDAQKVDRWMSDLKRLVGVYLSLV